MTRHDDKPLRGEAAWRAAKDRIAERNAAARARGAAERQAHETRQAEQRLLAERLERASRPKPPLR
jgi:hypothetical protein